MKLSTRMRIVVNMGYSTGSAPALKPSQGFVRANTLRVPLMVRHERFPLSQNAWKALMLVLHQCREMTSRTYPLYGPLCTQQCLIPIELGLLVKMEPWARFELASPC